MENIDKYLKVILLFEVIPKVFLMRYWYQVYRDEIIYCANLDVNDNIRLLVKLWCISEGLVQEGSGKREI